MSTASRRIAFTSEFLLAIVAVFAAWSQVGGQGHLDLMPWYAKLVLGLGLSAAVVGLTAALAGQESIRNRRSLYWGLLVIAVAGAMGAVTYYYHLHEVTDEPDDEGTTAHAALFLEC